MPILDEVPWPAVVEVAIRTTGEGPCHEDLFWQFRLDSGQLTVPSSAIHGLDELYRQLPGLDSEKIIRAAGSTDDRLFRVWHRDESPGRPGRDQLAARFQAVVERLGGAPAECRPAFDRLYAAWSAPERAYHNIEHLTDTLRELDRATSAVADNHDIAELALWYHDAIYRPGAPDNEARSGELLVSDARRLELSTATVAAAVAAVEATAHGNDQRAMSALGELVSDIDLSIFGCGAWRLLDYDFAIEAEYMPRWKALFRRRRARFLAGLLRRPLFRTEYFHARYERVARSNLAALVASPRYS